MRAPEENTARREERRKGVWETEIACRLPEKLLEKALQENISVQRAIVPEPGRAILRVKGADMERLRALCARYGLTVKSARPWAGSGRLCACCCQLLPGLRRAACCSCC